MRSDLRASVIDKIDGRISSYDINVDLDVETRTISGTERVDFVNETGEEQAEIPFRLYPNASYYGEGGLRIERVRVGGVAVTPTYAAEETVLSVPLTEPLVPGERVQIALRFTVTVPTDSTGTFGIFSFDSERGMWMLADWYPILAGWEEGRGWVLDPPTSSGDPTYSDVALYDLSLTMPSGLTVAATGTETPAADGDSTIWSIVSGPARELAMVIDDDFVVLTESVDGTDVSVFVDGNGEATAGAEIALDAATDVLSTYSDLFGPYPYDELDLVETELAGALGVSWTGLINLNGEQLLANSFYVDQEPDRLRFTVAHEVGHQWWGASVGLNSNDHAFLLEGLTNYLAIVATERTAGDAVAAQQLDVQCVQPYLRALRDSGDGIADVPISVETTGPSRGALMYGKAALGFLAIRQAMGDDAFFAALRSWAGENSFGISGPVGLLAAFEARTDVDVAALWSFWFQSAETTEADVLAMLD